uniref:WAT1-related protein n=1 Tax=Setaria italica TaxID=4555 RepID=K3ZNW1_SETIT
MEAKKPYVIAIIVQVIYTGMSVISKAAFDKGMNTFVFIFYRQVASSLLLLSFLLLFFLKGITFRLNLYNVSMKLTSATVASATFNSQPVVTFCLALLLRMEVVKLRSSSGIAKVTGVSLCLAGVLLQAGSSHARIKGTFLMVLANMSWSLWIVKQAAVLKEYPNKMLMKLSQCIFSTVQSFIVAVVAERDFSKWKLRLDISLQAIIYTMKGPVFLTVCSPLCLIFTIFCSSILGEIVHLGSIVGGNLLVGGHCVLWGKSKESKTAACNKEHKQTEEDKKGREDQKEATLESMVEQV